jgi:ketosteroid isomerase-like protein
MDNAAIVKAYYAAIAEKNRASIGQYLHPDVELISPFAQPTGKEAVLESADKFAQLIKSISIRSVFADKNQVMLAMDLEFSAPIGILRSAVLSTIKDGLIIKNELFYDTRQLERKKEEIFS